MRRKILLFFPLCFLLLPLALSAQDREEPVITVLDFQASGISAGEVTLFTDFIASHIVGTGRYTVIDRMQRRAILDEIEFSNADCTDEACQLEIGKLLSASQIVVGSLGKFGAKYILNIKLVEVETGKSLAASSKIYDSLDDLVADSQALAIGLLGLEAPAPAKEQVAAAAKEPTAAEKPAAPAAPEIPLEQTFPEELRIPRAAIRINGKFDDWAGVPSRLTDRTGDKRAIPAMGGVDIEKVLVAKDDRFLYVSFVLADGQMNWRATYNFGIDVIETMHFNLHTYYDEWQKRWVAKIGQWERVSQKWTDHELGMLWPSGNAFEARYPLSAIRNHIPTGSLYNCWANVSTQHQGRWIDMDSAVSTRLFF
jgi:hypothetical protein